jgi:hypothetical protein
MNLLFASKFNPSKTSHPNHAIEVLKLWLLVFIEEKN